MILQNPKHEAFAQGLADLLPEGEAYVNAGYRDSPASATRLSQKIKIRNRVHELQGATAKRMEITADSHVKELRRLAAKAENARTPAFGAAVKAEELIGKVAGLYIERVVDLSANMDDLKRDLLDDIGPLATSIVNHLFDGNPADDTTIRELVLAHGRK